MKTTPNKRKVAKAFQVFVRVGEYNVPVSKRNALDLIWELERAEDVFSVYTLDSGDVVIRAHR